MDQRYKTLQEEYQRLMTEHSRLEATNKQVIQDLEAEQQKARDLEMKQQLWKAKYSRIQAVITKDATNANEVIDSEVTAKVQHLRARIETIVKKHCVGDRVKPRRERQELEELDKEWMRREKQIPPQFKEPDVYVFLTYWVRSKIYLLLERRIFSRPCFGLDHDLESKLAEFEGLISKSAQGM